MEIGGVIDRSNKILHMCGIHEYVWEFFSTMCEIDYNESQFVNPWKKMSQLLNTWYSLSLILIVLSFFSLININLYV